MLRLSNFDGKYLKEYEIAHMLLKSQKVRENVLIVSKVCKYSESWEMEIKCAENWESILKNERESVNMLKIKII